MKTLLDTLSAKEVYIPLLALLTLSVTLGLGIFQSIYATSKGKKGLKAALMAILAGLSLMVVGFFVVVIPATYQGRSAEEKVTAMVTRLEAVQNQVKNLAPLLSAMATNIQTAQVGVSALEKKVDAFGKKVDTISPQLTAIITSAATTEALVRGDFESRAMAYVTTIKLRSDFNLSADELRSFLRDFASEWELNGVWESHQKTLSARVGLFTTRVSILEGMFYSDDVASMFEHADEIKASYNELLVLFLSVPTEELKRAERFRLIVDKCRALTSTLQAGPDPLH